MNSRSFCVLPWIHLATHPNGGVSLCCRSNHTNAISWAKKSNSSDLMLLEDTDIKEIINSDTLIRVRQSMIDGNRPNECEGCWRDEASGIESKRQYENERWAHLLPFLELEPKMDNVNYRYIELRLGNVCNSACVTCNSYSSSKWYRDEKKLSAELDWFKLRLLENFTWFKDKKFYESLAQVSNDVEEIYINGGEPTLIEEHFIFLQSLIENNQSQKIHLIYSLNMTNLPDNFLKLLSFFKKVTINCSIDDLEQRNYYIRWPTNWNDVLKNLDKISKLDNAEWTITQTVSFLNITNLGNFRKFFVENYNKEPVHNYVLYPEYLSVKVIPIDYRNKLLSDLENKLTLQQFNNLKGKFEINFDKELSIMAKNFINTLDKSRNLEIKNFIPEFTNII